MIVGIFPRCGKCGACMHAFNSHFQFKFSRSLGTAAGSRRTFRAGHTAHGRHMQPIEKLDLGRSRQELGMGMFRLRSFSFGWIQFGLDINTRCVW